MVERGEPVEIVVVVSYFFTDSFYPRAGPSAGHDELYWSNIAVQAATLRHVAGRRIRFQVHCAGEPPAALAGLLADAEVELVHTPFDHRPPEGFYDRWAGTLYLLDTATALARDIADDAVVLFVDPDLVWVRELGPLVDEVQRRGIIAYELQAPPDLPIVGLTRRQQAEMFEAITGSRLTDVPPHYGGEFYGVLGSRLRELVALLPPLWSATLQRHRDGLDHYNLEEHVLNAALWQLGVLEGRANRYLERIMTLPAPFGSRQRYRPELVAWHLPTEKMVGFRKVLDHLAAGRELPPVDDGYHAWMKRRMGIDRTARHLARDVSRWVYWKASGKARRARQQGHVGLGL